MKEPTFFKVLRYLMYALAVFVIFTECNGKSVDTDNEEPETQYVYITVECCYDYDIVYDPDTKVMYHLSRGVYNQGNLTLLVNPDGTPKIYGHGIR